MEKMTEQQQRMDKLIARLEEHQKAIGLGDNDTRFVTRYQKFLGSLDSWQRGLKARDWARLGKSITRWETNLTRRVGIINGGQEIAVFYETVPIWKHTVAMYDVLQGQTTDRRVVFLIGPTGIAKSWSMKWLAIKNPSKCAYLYADEGWNESMNQICTSVATVIGASIDKTSPKKTFANITELLAGSPTTVLLDDFQKAGVLGLKLVKNWVDATPSRFVLGVYPSSWNKLVAGSTDAMSEAQQVLGRTIRPIEERWLKGLGQEDIVAYLKASAVKGDLTLAAGNMKKAVQVNGNYRVLADAVSDAATNAEEKDEELTAALVEACMLKRCPIKKQEERM